MQQGAIMARAESNRKARGERGVILILVMLVTLVLACVMVQLFFTTSVNKEITHHKIKQQPMRMAAMGAFLQAKAVLLQDMENQSSGDDEMGGDDPGAGEGEGMGQGGEEGDPEEGDGGEEGTGDATANSDSLVDEWARPGAITVMTSNDLDVMVLVRDEDSKFNLLSVIAQDEEMAEESRIRLARLIDTFRESTKGDVSRAQSERIVDDLVEWLEGKRDRERFPTPTVKTGADDLEPDRLDDEPIHYPLTVEELQMCESLTKEILFGYKDGPDRIPGLIEFITCYSNLIFDSVPEDEEEAEDDSFGEEPPPEEENPPGGEGEEGDDEDDEVEAEPVETNSGRVNINTAPYPVLRGLMEDSDIPNSVLEKIIEFREKAIEVYEDLQDRDGEFGSILEEDEEDEDFIFTTPTEVFERVEEYFNTTFNLDDDVEETFTNLLATTSNVFTVYISVRTSEGKLSQNYRAVIWRWSGTASETGDMEDEEEEDPMSGEARIITLVPLELYPYPLPLSPEEEEQYLATF